MQLREAVDIHRCCVGVAIRRTCGCVAWDVCRDTTSEAVWVTPQDTNRAGWDASGRSVDCAVVLGLLACTKCYNGCTTNNVNSS